jgi:peroxiredoxin
MQELMPQFEQARATLVAVSPDGAANLEEMAAARGLTFPVLHDPGLEVTGRYGLAYDFSAELAGIYQGFGLDIAARNQEPTARLPVPASYVIDPDGFVRYAFIEEDYMERPEPTELLAAVQGIN